MTTYYLSYEDANGDNMDLFVFAETPEDTLEAWKNYYEHEVDFGPVTADRPFEDYLRIVECPESGGQRPGAVQWDGVSQWFSILSWEE